MSNSQQEIHKTLKANHQVNLLIQNAVGKSLIERLRQITSMEVFNQTNHLNQQLIIEAIEKLSNLQLQDKSDNANVYNDNEDIQNQDNGQNQRLQGDEELFGQEDEGDGEEEVDQDELNDWVHHENGQEQGFDDQGYENNTIKYPSQDNRESRYPEAAQMKRVLDENLLQMKARVQLLKITEHRNLQKAKILDINSQKLQQNKFGRLQKLDIKKRFLDEEQDRQEKKKQDIKIQREKHKLSIQNKQGEQGRIQQQTIQEIRLYKEKNKINHYNTLESVYLENCLLHKKVQEDQKFHQSKQLKLWEDKYFKGQNNYKERVQLQINSAASKQEQLEDLERKESDLLQQLKVQYFLYMNIRSHNKYTKTRVINTKKQKKQIIKILLKFDQLM